MQYFDSIKLVPFYTAFKIKISKLDYISKAEGLNVRGIGTFLVICSNLDQLFLYNFKNLYFHFPQKINLKFNIPYVVYRTF